MSIYLCSSLFQKGFEELKFHIKVVIVIKTVITVVTFFNLASHCAKKLMWVMSFNPAKAL